MRRTGNRASGFNYDVSSLPTLSPSPRRDGLSEDCELSDNCEEFNNDKNPLVCNTLFQL